MLKIHLGCGNIILNEWINVDLIDSPLILKHDLSTPLPYPDNSVDFIFSEHFLEHLDEIDGYNLLVNCYKKLKPGGALRMSIPCLDAVLFVYQNWDKKETFHPYIKQFHNETQFINWAFFGESSTSHKNKFLNNLVSTNDGHKFLYSKNNLFDKIMQIGFSSVVEKNKKESSFEQLKNLETRQYICDLTFEAVK